jgi:hypothetical protein
MKSSVVCFQFHAGLFLGLILSREDLCQMFLRNVCWLSRTARWYIPKARTACLAICGTNYIRNKNLEEVYGSAFLNGNLSFRVVATCKAWRVSAQSEAFVPVIRTVEQKGWRRKCKRQCHRGDLLYFTDFLGSRQEWALTALGHWPLLAFQTANRNGL